MERGHASSNFPSSACSLWLLGNNRNHLKPVWEVEGGPGSQVGVSVAGYAHVCMGYAHVCAGCAHVHAGCTHVHVGVSACTRSPHQTSRTEHISISLVLPALSPPLLAKVLQAPLRSHRTDWQLLAKLAGLPESLLCSRHHLSSARSHSGGLSSHQLVLLSSISGGGSSERLSGPAVRRIWTQTVWLQSLDPQPHHSFCFSAKAGASCLKGHG